MGASASLVVATITISTSGRATAARQSARRQAPGTVCASARARSGSGSAQATRRAPPSASARFRPIRPHPTMATPGHRSPRHAAVPRHDAPERIDVAALSSVESAGRFPGIPTALISLPVMPSLAAEPRGTRRGRAVVERRAALRLCLSMLVEIAGRRARARRSSTSSSIRVFERAGRDRVDVDAERPHLQRQRFGEPHDRGLRGGVGADCGSGLVAPPPEAG